MKDEIKNVINDEIKNEINDVVLSCEGEKEIQFDRSFKITLGLSLGLTGIISLSGLAFFSYGIANRVWVEKGTSFFLNNSLFFVAFFLCFASLVNIARTRRPFSKILVLCTMSIGTIFVAASVIFPHISGYITSSFQIMSKGDKSLIDGMLLMIGVLCILFSRVIRYGFLYQNNTDMTV